jgi:hypothetical protein
MSIDPNLTHRGIANPQSHVVAILNHFGLQRNVVVSAGYSMDKSLSNDGFSFSGEVGDYDPYLKFDAEEACEDTLSNLALTSPRRFDFAVIDGNHNAEYLRRETALMHDLLAPNGVLIVEDVSDAWADIKAEYAGLGSKGWKPAGADGRVGILQAG